MIKIYTSIRDRLFEILNLHVYIHGTAALLKTRGRNIKASQAGDMFTLKHILDCKPLKF